MVISQMASLSILRSSTTTRTILPRTIIRHYSRRQQQQQQQCTIAHHFISSNPQYSCSSSSCSSSSSSSRRRNLTTAITSTNNTTNTHRSHIPLTLTQTSPFSSSSSYPPHTILTLPALSPTMETGRVAKWHKSEGESFSAGEVLCEIETDKATVDYEAQDDGILAKILIGDVGGDEHNVGVPICVVVEEEYEEGAFDGLEIEEAVRGQEFPVASPFLEVEKGGKEEGGDLGSFVLLPSARHLSHSRGVDASVLYPGSGKDGRVTKGDVLDAIDKGIDMPPLLKTNTATTPVTTAAATPLTATTTAPPTTTTTTAPATIPTITNNPHTDIPNNNMRKVIAKRLTESKATVPHFYSTATVNIDAILSLRQQLVKNLDVKISVNDIIVRAAGLALRDVPEMNARFVHGKIQTSSSVDVCVAVATPTGLITPIVPTTDRLGLSEINATVKDLATRARDGKLKPEEYQGGTFTISNLGMFGIKEFTAVINPPQCAILAVGAGVKTVVGGDCDDGESDSDDDAVKKKYATKTMMSVRLSADRRVVDEPIAGLFLQALTGYLEKPNLLML